MLRLRRFVPIFALVSQLGAISASLTVRPSFLLVDEDWDLSKLLPVEICSDNVRIIAGDPGRFFTVVQLNATCSTLRVNKNFDADKVGTDGSPGESFSLVLQGGRRSRATLEIQTSPGGFAIATLRTRDVDTGISGMARFSVDNDLFAVDKAKCLAKECYTTIRLARTLDFETQRAHHVLVTAEDGNPHSNRTNSAIHALTIHVIDEDDEPPIFVTDLSKPIQLSASQAVGDVIVTLRAVDGDEVMTNKTKIRYSIEENEYLEIEPTSGSVKLKKMPGPHIELRVKVTATEESGRGMESVDVLRVRGPPEQKTEDQVKFAELCESPAYSARIKEGASDFEEPLIVRLTSPVNPSALRIEGAGAAFVVDPSSTSVDVRIVPSNASLVDYEKQKTMELFVGYVIFQSCVLHPS
uniref:CA domain-containing protein n=1 Tax=Angiostrongylus cantonensis TaxID=6313 RepID=A0A158PAH7_ANGCA